MAHSKHSTILLCYWNLISMEWHSNTGQAAGRRLAFSKVTNLIMLLIMATVNTNGSWKVCSQISTYQYS
jgi:hypothetical protein